MYQTGRNVFKLVFKTQTNHHSKSQNMIKTELFFIKFFFKDELLTQMKHRSRILSIAVTPILFSRAARHFFQNDATLRGSNTFSLVRIFRLNRMKKRKRNNLCLDRWNLLKEISLIYDARYLCVFRMLLQVQLKVH